MTIDFSIIIPAKNEEFNIAQCLESINKVDYDQERYEIILVDNGSTDRTVDVATQQGATVFVRPDDTIAALRNFGAEMAQGKVLAFLDADCTVDHHWLKAASLYINQEDIAAFGSPAILPDKSTWVQRAWYPIRCKSKQVQEVDWHESAHVFVQKKLFDQIGGFDETLTTCEDYDLSVRLQKKGKLVSDGRIIAVHHREPATVREFFNKECWRSSSNRERLLSGNFNVRELPSLILPIIYILLAMASGLMMALFGLFDSTGVNAELWLLLVFWQLPLLLIACWKLRHDFNFTGAAHLYLLLNVYFFARGIACLRRN